MKQNLIGQKIKTFTFMSLLGEGAWAKVYEAIDERDDSQVAIKVIPQSLIKQTPKLEELIKTQVRVLKMCKNDNVIRYVDNFMSNNCIFIATQYCNGGDLEKYLEKKRRLAEDQATNFLKQILNGFRGLHEVKAMHRDFKVANVLLHNNICKIADLGFAKQLQKQKSITKTILGTSLTMAPQVLSEKPYGYQADIWSIGVVYYQLLYGKYPYDGMSDADILKNIKTNRPSYSGVNISPNCKDFIDRCLQVQPTKRISWRQIYQHELITKNNQQIIYNLKSRINVNDNRNFYQKAPQISEDLMYVQKKQAKKNNNLDINFDQTQIRQSINIEKLRQMNEQKKKIDNTIEKYEKKYLNRRNNIMFIFKFVSPYVYSLNSIKANHGITMFIMSKKAFLEMKDFYNNLVKRNNFLKLDPFFNEFVKSKSYDNLIQIAKSDMDIIQAQIWSYKEDIDNCSSQIKAEYDINKIANPKWNDFVDDTIGGYWFLLAQGLDTTMGAQKQDLIKVMQAMDYYRNNSENADIEQFDKMIESINYTKSENQIRQKVKSIFQQ